MSDQTPKIMWEQWKDPFLYLDKEDEDENDSSLDSNDYEEIMKNKEFKESISNQQRNKIGPGHVMITPLGMVPITDYNIPSKHYEFWLGHCNFTINRQFAEFLNIIPGVRTLDILDRYVFRISIGKLFNGNEVRSNIEKALSSKKSTETKLCDNYLKQHLSRKYAYWAILKLGDGNSDILGDSDKDKIEDKIINYPGNNIKDVIKSWQ